MGHAHGFLYPMERTATACCLCSSSVRGWLGPNFALHRIMPCPVEAIDTQPVWGHLEPRISKVFCPARILSNHSGRILRIRLVSPKATAASTKSSFALPSPSAGSSDLWRRHQAEATPRKLRVVFTWLPSPLSGKPKKKKNTLCGISATWHRVNGPFLGGSKPLLDSGPPVYAGESLPALSRE